MKTIIIISIQLCILMLAGIGFECDNFFVRFLLFLLACLGMNVYHEYLKKIENENK